MRILKNPNFLLTDPPRTDPSGILVGYGRRQSRFDEFGQRVRRQHVTEHWPRHPYTLDDR